MSSVQPSQVGDASRVALARLALDVVSSIQGVAGTDAGPGGLCVTADPPFGVLQGVSVIAQPDGRYEVDLCLVARIVPLLPLGDDIRSRLRARAAREGLAEQLGAVNVEFARALSAGETMVEVPGTEVALGAEAVPGTTVQRVPPVPPVPTGAGSPIPPGSTVSTGAGSPIPPVSTGSTGSQIPVPPIPPADRAALPDEPPAELAEQPLAALAEESLAALAEESPAALAEESPAALGQEPPAPSGTAPPPRPAPRPTTQAPATAPPGPSAVPEEPPGSVGRQTSPDRERRS